jgi:hypothetical protein
MNRAAQLPIIAVLVLALLGSAGARKLCLDQRRDLDRARNQPVTQGGDVSRLNSFALGLLLGGLRGPMLMVLWTSSENQKTDRELEDFDTKVELIRLLQAEFDGVHLFQVWNKAYNISVQMANVPTKYTTILDAMDYAFNVDAERPDNINILASIAGLYFDKFGNAAEKGYFSPRLMDETLPVQDRVFPAEKRELVLRQARLAGASPYVLSPREVRDDMSKRYIQVRKPIADNLQARLKDPDITYELREVKPDAPVQIGARRTEHESILDDQYRILPEFLEPRQGMFPTGDAGDGSKLPYLPQFEPYPYGVSPFALGYNYYKRAQFLQNERGARHAQLSDRVISSRAGLSLKKWSEEDWRIARRAEIELFGMPVPSEDAALEQPTQSIALDQKLATNPLLEEIIWRYDNAARIADAAVEEYAYHLKSFPEDIVTYASHAEGSDAQAEMMKGDAFYLKAMLATGDQKQQLARQAAEHYRNGANLYSRHILRYYLADEDAGNILPPRVTRADVLDPLRFPDNLVPLSMAKARALHMSSNYQMGNSEDFAEIDAYIQRANARLASIANLK